MIMNRTMLYSVIGIVLLATTGIAYAAFTSTATANYSGSAGTLNLSFTSVGTVTTSEGGSMTNPSNGPTTPVPGGPFGTCSVTINNAGQLVIQFTNAAPGDECTFSGTFTNTGTLPAATIGINYTMTQSYPHNAQTCNAITGDGNCLWYPNDWIQGSSGSPTGSGVLGQNLVCSGTGDVGSTAATAAHCWVLDSVLAGISVSANGGTGMYGATIEILGLGDNNFPGQLGAVSGMSATQIVSIVGYVGATYS